MGGGEREGERREDGRVRGGKREGGRMGWWGGGGEREEGQVGGRKGEVGGRKGDQKMDGDLLSNLVALAMLSIL